MQAHLKTITVKVNLLPLIFKTLFLYSSAFDTFTCFNMDYKSWLNFPQKLKEILKSILLHYNLAFSLHKFNFGKF